MQTRLIRRRFRRTIRKGQRQIEDLGVQAEQGLEEHLFKRFERLFFVRRFVSAWLVLVLLMIGGLVAQNLALSGYYQRLETVPGGIYNEGVLGTFTNANPLYATSDADTTVSSLVFASLFNYNEQGSLVGDLASDFTVNSRGDTYTVHLKPNLTWQDGQPLTSADVVFTYHAIQNPDVQSPLESGWAGVTVTASDPQTVVFKLPDPLASFPYSLTNGIVPQHVLAGVPAVDLRSADFNTDHPIGSGPFAWQALQVSGDTPANAQTQIALVPFAHYQGGEPKLQEFIVHAFADQTQLVDAFKSGQLTSAEGLTEVPQTVQGMSSLQVHNLILRAATMVFFKTSAGVLSDQKVRQALVQGANVPAIMKQLGYPTPAVREPLLTGQLAYDPSEVQASYNKSVAQTTLAGDGWVAGKGGVLEKGGQPLTFTLTAADTPENHMVANALQKQWRAIGVTMQEQLQTPTDFQTTLTSHDYDAVLYGISIGVDPDVFVYWDSSQADVRSDDLNLSEYKNSTADLALEAGRTRLDATLRTVKYKPFLEAWQQDAPALGLYQPRLLYLTNGTVGGLSDNTINKPSDRFINVQNWEIRVAKVTE